ncbi:hypothetical protein P8452_65688 [Trifolium repens]|nr:hypothetical protein P8452_65688 [Trifolium repens]
MEEEDIGRGRHGRDTSKAHASARLKSAAPAPKRGRGRHGQSWCKEHMMLKRVVQLVRVHVHEYHKHRAIPIWDANSNDHAVLKRNLCCVASGMKVIDIQKPDHEQRWFWGPIEAAGLAPLTKTNFSVLDVRLLGYHLEGGVE